MVEQMLCYNFKFHHISCKKNEITDCFSRLTRSIREAEHFGLEEPILADRSVIKKIGVKTKFQAEDPWVENLANSAMMDTNYNIMIQHLETGADILEIPKDCELQEMASYFKKLSVFTLKGGQSIILKDNNEILIPEKERQNLMGLAHAENHRGLLRGRVFWPHMTKQISHMVSSCDP